MGIETLFRRGSKEPKPNPTIRLNKFVSVEVQRGVYNPFLDMLHPNTFNLENAAENGIKLLTLRDVSRQIEPPLHGNLILFDTSPDLGANLGNHFRLVKKEGNTKLQACTQNGFWDSKGVLPIEIPQDFAMFTGAKIVVAERDNGKIVPLGEAQNYWQTHTDAVWAGEGEIHYRGAITMWSNNDGEIRPQLELPLASR